MDINVKRLNKIFTLMPCVEKIPYQIECMTCFNNIFILGLNSGQLLVYSINTTTNSIKYEVNLEKSIKSITKKPIQQLKAIYLKDITLLIALFEAQIHIFDLQTYQHKYTLPKTKGAILFTSSINLDTNLIYLIVVCKKRLQFYYLNIGSTTSLNQKQQFMDLINDIELTDTPKCIEMTQNNILCFSLKKEYYKYELPLPGQSSNNKTFDIKEVFSVGIRDPLCYKMNDSNVAFCIENQTQDLTQTKCETIILDNNLQPHLRYPLVWSSSPSMICNIGPFMIGLLPQLNSIEVLTIKPKSIGIQVVDFTSSTTTTSSSIASNQSTSNLTNLFSSSTPTSFFSSLKESTSTTNLKETNSIDRIKYLISNTNNSICYVATQTNVWCLIPTSINEQLDNLIKLHSFSLALNLIDVYDKYKVDYVQEEDEGVEESTVNIFKNDKIYRQQINDDLIIKIKHLNAFDLYRQKQFEKSMKLFEEFKQLDPIYVISFVPGLLPDLKRQEVLQVLQKESLKLPDLTSQELEQAIEYLIDYLQFKRKEFINIYNISMAKANTNSSNNNNSTFQLYSLIENKQSKTSLKQILEIIDTTLLQCYLKIREQLVKNLLRREQTYFHLETSEKLLKQHQKLNELLILYERKDKHAKALELLLSESNKNGSTLFGDQHLINYLRKLGNSNLNLIFEYSKDVLERLSLQGLKVFMNVDDSDDLIDDIEFSNKFGSLNDTQLNSPDVHNEEDDDDDEVLKHIDRKQVCEFIQNKIEPNELSVKLLFYYVEYCVYKWKDKTEYLNSLLIRIYKLKLNELFQTNDNNKFLKLKEKLLKFLSDTNEYDIQKALSQFDVDSEERAILLGKLGKHEDALKIYVYKLNNTQKAEEYCKQVYKNQSKYPNSSNIYFYLLNMYLKSDNYEQRNVNSIKLLNEYSNEIASSNSGVVNLTLDMLPDDINLSNIQQFINIMLIQSNKLKHSCQLMKNLLFSLNLQINDLKLVQQSTKFVLNEEKCCYKCNKRIGKSAIVRYPNGTIIHYGCCKDSNVLNIN